MCLVELLLLEIIGDQGLQGSGQGGDGPVTRTRLGLGLKLGLERADLLLHLGYSLDIRAQMVQDLMGIRIGVLGHFRQGSERIQLFVGGGIGLIGRVHCKRDKGLFFILFLWLGGLGRDCEESAMSGTDKDIKQEGNSFIADWGLGNEDSYVTYIVGWDLN
jgi:hypothetical protein